MCHCEKSPRTLLRSFKVQFSVALKFLESTACNEYFVDFCFPQTLVCDRNFCTPPFPRLLVLLSFFQAVLKQFQRQMCIYCTFLMVSEFIRKLNSYSCTVLQSMKEIQDLKIPKKLCISQKKELNYFNLFFFISHGNEVVCALTLKALFQNSKIGSDGSCQEKWL